MSVYSGRQFRSVIFRHNVEIGKGPGRRADLGCVIRERTIPGQQCRATGLGGTTLDVIFLRVPSPRTRLQRTYPSITRSPICILKLNSSCRIIIYSAKLHNTRIRYYIICTSSSGINRKGFGGGNRRGKYGKSAEIIIIAQGNAINIVSSNESVYFTFSIKRRVNQKNIHLYTIHSYGIAAYAVKPFKRE